MLICWLFSIFHQLHVITLFLTVMLLNIFNLLKILSFLHCVLWVYYQRPADCIRIFFLGFLFPFIDLYASPYSSNIPF